MTTVADALSDLQVGFPGILEKLSEFRTHIRVLLEQELFEHDAVDADHLLQMRSEKVHDSARFDVWSEMVTLKVSAAVTPQRFRIRTAHPNIPRCGTARLRRCARKSRWAEE